MSVTEQSTRASRLATTYLGLPLTGPVIASAGPRTRTVESMLALEKAGAAAVVLPSLFEEEVIAEEEAIADAFDRGADFAEFSEMMPDIPMPDLGPERHVRLVEQAKAALTIPVIASVNATHTGSWSRYATMMADAGADAIELNLYAVAADPTKSAAEVENDYLSVIEQVRAAVSVPLAVKLSPFFTSFAHFAARAVDSGANGLVVFNRFYAPDLDIETLSLEPKVDLSGPGALRMPLRWLGILRSQLPQSTSLAATSGVHSGADVIKALLVGASVACTTAAVVKNGPGVVSEWLDEIDGWLVAREYDGIDQLRGSLSATASGDPATFERSQYIKIVS
ncbi:MAG: dihydroorotate dehydrogenase-like protein [Dermatophilus congolensis]|nr:dihydroorotate dehydrogenase-like protein [Dermatophilus congolensis]